MNNDLRNLIDELNLHHDVLIQYKKNKWSYRLREVEYSFEVIHSGIFNFIRIWNNHISGNIYDCLVDIIRICFYVFDELTGSGYTKLDTIKRNIREIEKILEVMNNG